MKKNIVLSNHWELKKIEPTAAIEPMVLSQDETNWLSIEHMPAQVQDVLLQHRLLPEEMLVGWCEETTWIADFDWVYRLKFKKQDNENARLLFQGLDTFADIYLNNQLILRHHNFYLPNQADISDLLQEENILLIHFHRTKDYLERLPLEEKWVSAVPHCKMIRKPVHDFPPEVPVWGSNYQGAVPYFTPIGVYRDITMQLYNEVEITETDVAVSADDSYNGSISVALKGKGKAKGIKVTYALLDRKGYTVQEGDLPYICGKDGSFMVRECLVVETPVLWQPRGFGDAYLYNFHIKIYDIQASGEETLADEWKRQIGFKNVKIPSPLEFIINGNRVRLWGGSLDPLQGFTHCFIPSRAERLYDMIENANFNTLRIWGEGIPYPDEFYEMADRRGILIWQEFFMGHGAVPDSPYYVEEYKKEATCLIKRLKHRASLLMWCGGNETIMGAEFYGYHPFGKEVLEKDFKEVVRELDPNRYYHPNSPYGGEWANDPRAGDYHTYDCVWEYPYKDYPNFISEHIRTSPPVIHSLKRIIKGDVWEEGYEAKQKYDDAFILPKNWVERSNISASGDRKTGAFWEYYDADNAEDMIYRFGASYGQEIRRYGEQIRRGSRIEKESSQRSKGYLTCKLLDTWPKNYCSTIDFFQEGYIPYYSVARLFRPVMLSFAKEDSIKLWVVNDSAEAVKGKVTVGIYHLGTEEFLRQNELDISVGQGDASMVFDLAVYQFFPKDCILFAKLENEKGEVIHTNIDFVDIERHLHYKDAKIKVQIEENELVIQSDKFVRCVEVKGKDGEDEFGWLFSDNYFDLMPNMPKRIRILGKKTKGSITVKGHYMKHSETINFLRV